MSHQNFYENVVNKTRKIKHDPLGLVSFLNELIHKINLYKTTLRSLNIVFLVSIKTLWSIFYTKTNTGSI